MDEKKIPAYVVNGFLEAGKTTYIQENIFRDFFHKRGKTLILSFEEGEKEYDIERLSSFRTTAVQFEGGDDIPAFCMEQIEKHQPDRIYIEANAMMDGLASMLPPVINVVDTTTLIDGSTLPLYFNNLRQQLQTMVSSSNMVIFGRCEDKASLAGYSTPFHLMNSKCVYLWESPMGYSEQAFGLFLPYDLDQPVITVTDEIFPVWALDAGKYPQHYNGKKLDMIAQASLRDYLPEDSFFAGRLIMACCPADMQFLGAECINNAGIEITERCWIHIIATGIVKEDRYHVKRLVLEPDILEYAPAGKQIISG